MTRKQRQRRAVRRARHATQYVRLVEDRPARPAGRTPRRPPPTSADLNRHLVAAYKRADQLSDKLVAILGRVLTTAGGTAARSFEQRATDHLTAAGQQQEPVQQPAPGAPQKRPPWTAPAADEIVNVPALIRTLRGKTDPVRQALVKTVMTPALDAHGLAFDITNPLTAGVLAQSGSHIVGIAQTTQLNVMRIVKESYDNGLSIPDTAKAIRVGMKQASPARSMQIARTEMVGAAAGGSLAATKIVSDATGSTFAKVWRTAPGAPHPRHENYEGLDQQTVGLNDTFTVGADQLQFPGDPSGSPEETISCRCTLTFAEPSALATPAAIDASAAPVFRTGRRRTVAAVAKPDPVAVQFAALAAGPDVQELVELAEAELEEPELRDYLARRIEPPLELAQPVLDRIGPPSGALRLAPDTRLSFANGHLVIRQPAAARRAVRAAKKVAPRKRYIAGDAEQLDAMRAIRASGQRRR